MDSPRILGEIWQFAMIVWPTCFLYLSLPVILSVYNAVFVPNPSVITQKAALMLDSANCSV